MVTYRCNIMSINSLENFAGVRGGYNNDIKDVYFARIIGSSTDIEKKIVEVDKTMGLEMNNGKLDYYRFSQLPKIISQEDVIFYTEVYESIVNKKDNCKFRNIKDNEALRESVFYALKRVADVYKESKKSVTDSIAKNLSVKALFWLDSIGEELFANWDVKRCIKVIAENIVKEQEYLFFYFLTQIGCDVLLLELEKDIEIPNSLKNLSQVVSKNPFAKTVIPDYKKYVPEQIKSVSSSVNRGAIAETKSESENGLVKVVIPERNRKQKTSSDSERREKSFEELAQLASSIVLIAVHDKDNEVTATGSGIMIGRGGYILTNCHVIAGGHSFSVRIEEDEEIYRTSEVIKYNPNFDLAVIRIQKELNPLPIYRGKQKLVRGQKVVAIGSPLGLFNSVSDGIISGFRKFRDEDMIQFTAPISHGSSGGALLNMYGEVIGISTAGIDSGQNINLAMGYESILLFAGSFLG